MNSLEAIVNAIGELEKLRDHSWYGYSPLNAGRLKETIYRLRCMRQALEVVETMDGRRHYWDIKPMPKGDVLPGFEEILGVLR